MLRKLRRVLKSSLQARRTIVLVTPAKFSGTAVDVKDGTKSFHLLPVRTSQIRKLLDADADVERRQRNVRYLQRCIRYKKPDGSTIPLARPYVEWDFLDKSPTDKLLVGSRLDKALAKNMIRFLNYAIDDEMIKKAVLGIGRRKQALEAWEADEMPDEDETKDRWSKFPDHAQKTLREISQDGDGYEREALKLVVDPMSAEEAWASIAVDEEMVSTVKRVVAHHQDVGRADSGSYGILKREHTGGALFYGPPGTGKTQLARVLAATTDSVVIVAAAADVQSCFCGESPKVVKGLFSVARRVAPSIIFFDEADALFGVRTSDTSSSGIFYRETTTQLLTEMDGFAKQKDNPVVILATNLPTLLDPAVLRRVPHATYMGPPTLGLREKIFRIMLRDEVLDAGVDVAKLAGMTPGFTGSDIKSLCVRAALLCDQHVEEGEDKGKRLLTSELFEKALGGGGGGGGEARPAAAVKEATASLREFARKHDPAGYRAMQAVDREMDSDEVRLRQEAMAARIAGLPKVKAMLNGVGTPPKM